MESTNALFQPCCVLLRLAIFYKCFTIFIDHKSIHFLVEVDRNSFSGGKDSNKTEIKILGFELET